MSGKGADVHKENLTVEGAAEDEKDGGSLSLPNLSKKKALIGGVVFLILYGAYRWITTDQEGGADPDGDEADDEDEQEGTEIEIAEDVNFSEFDDVDVDQDDDEDDEDLSYDETQERAAEEISEDKPY
jgi:hypothetical protein